MPETAGSVCLQAAQHLNDPSQLVYTTPVLIPYLNMSIQELDEELGVYEVTPMRKESITIEVAAGATVLAQYPVDYVETIELSERLDGTSDDWIPVGEVLAIDTVYITKPIESIVQWAARNSLIAINPPTIAREVLLHYIAGLTTAANSATAIDITASKRYLALLTAKNAARDAGNSKTKADSFSEDITRARDRVIRRLSKNVQTASGVRRRPYRGRSF